MTPEKTYPPHVSEPNGASSIVLVCEHAANAFPMPWGDLGLPSEARTTHIAWDPGALLVARRLSDRLRAPLIEGTVSRLIYDCNRPPEAPDAMPPHVDGWNVPGNGDLSEAARNARVAAIYDPFHAAVAASLAALAAPILVTIHSFTSVLAGRARKTEIGLVHDADDRLAMSMHAHAPARFRVALNDPYGPEDGVTHTLRRHALPAGHLNVMLEIRNDLIADPRAQATMGDLLANWLTAALEDARCSA